MTTLIMSPVAYAQEVMIPAKIMGGFFFMLRGLVVNPVPWPEYLGAFLPYVSILTGLMRGK